MKITYKQKETLEISNVEELVEIIEKKRLDHVFYAVVDTSIFTVIMDNDKLFSFPNKCQHKKQITNENFNNYKFYCISDEDLIKVLGKEG